MDFSFTESQQLLRDSIDRFLSAKHDLRTRAQLLDDPQGQDRLWREMAELGWIGAAIPEAAGGYSTSPVDAMVVAERLGRHLVTAPFVVSAIVCGRLLQDGPSGDSREDLIARLVGGELQLALAAGGGHVLRSPEHVAFTAARSAGGWRLSGRAPVVLNGERADQLIVAARTAGSGGERQGITLFLIDADAPGVSRRGFRMIDGHGAAEVTIDGLSVGPEAVLGPVDGGVPLVERALDHGIAAVCAEALGSMDHLVTATAAYTRTREQYGAPLAKFQVLQHRMADMYIQTETARSMAYFATLSLDAPEPVRQRDLSSAKVQVSRSGKFVGYHAVQLHGGMGVTEALDIGPHYVRLTVINQLFGDQNFHLKRFAELNEHLDTRGSNAA
jgi:alkylation response protein AidB-like acyl-CoA dehydrogenase